MNGGEVLLALFELPGACGNEVISGKWFDKIGDKEGGHWPIVMSNGRMGSTPCAI